MKTSSLTIISFLSNLNGSYSKGNAHHQSSDSLTNTSTDNDSSQNLDQLFPADFQPIHKGDNKLINSITQYMQMVFPEGILEEVDNEALLKNEHRNPPFRADSLAQKWYPVDCRLLGLDLRKKEVIYKGRRNTVIKKVDRKTKTYYAWKGFDDAMEYTAELSFFVFADHPNIVRPICILESRRGMPGILMEFVDGGKSIDYARQHRNNPERLKQLAVQAYDVLKYIHWLGFVHADFKPENILIDKMGNAKAIDFGFAIPLPFFRHYRGTPTTMAPELVKATPGPIQENIDMWALGSSIAQWYGVAYDLPRTLTKDGRHHKWTPMRISKTHGYSFGELPLNLPWELRQLLYYTMHPQPKMRMFNTRTQLKWLEALSFWQKVNFTELEQRWINA